MDYRAPLFLLSIYISCLLLHMILPGRNVAGYVCENDGKVLQYKLNGVVVFIAISSCFLCLGLEEQALLYKNFGSVVFAANAIGLLASAYFYTHPQLKDGEPYERAITRDQVDQSSGRLKRKSGITMVDKTKQIHPFLVFFLGRDFNPRIAGVDVKMWLYIVGAVGLFCNILSAVAHQRILRNGSLSLAMTVYAGCFAWFLVEYLLGEEVHLYTYDIFAEKIGFKLVWGCLVFYPCFYCIGVIPIAMAQPTAIDMTSAQAAFTTALFFCGWIITRGANMQKFCYRTQPACKTFLFGLVRQECIPGTRILVSGWWGAARHFNYFGEIVQAIALSIPALLVGPDGWKWITLLYPLYYIALFVPRQFDDDALCRAKYGPVWDEYVARVPSRIVPFVW